jgi:transcriptional regulator with XRE-family HTH domain
MSATRERFALNLQALRAHMGQTVDVMAHALDVKRSSMSGYLNGASEPHLELLHRIQQRYNVGMDLMLGAELHLLTNFNWNAVRSAGGPRTLEQAVR